ncbi:MAG: cytochrome c oxidase assembly protein [Nocardioidaceae bacterium]
MSMPMAPLTWHTFLTTWHANTWWNLVIVVVLAAYVAGLVVARRKGERGVRAWRATLFLVGLAVLVVSLNSAIEGYGHELFWMHMVQHLLLIMVVPALLVVGQPLRLLVQVTGGSERSPVQRGLLSRASDLLFHPLTGLAIYTIIIVGTHLTSFMQQMLTHMWLHQSEHVLYLLGGFVFLVPLLGNEPIRWRLPYPVRMLLLFVAMAPDTIVGIVLLQTEHEPFPAYAEMHRMWGPSLVKDIQTGGGIMWAIGDGIMMCFLVGVIVAWLANSSSNATAGSWLEGVRRSTLSENLAHAGGDASSISETDDLDEDEAALAAYNKMLRGLNQKESEPGTSPGTDSSNA